MIADENLSVGSNAVRSGPARVYGYTAAGVETVRVSASGNPWIWAAPGGNNGVRVAVGRWRGGVLVEEGLDWDVSNQGSGQYFTLDRGESVLLQFFEDRTGGQAGVVSVKQTASPVVSSQVVSSQAAADDEPVPGDMVVALAGEPHFVGLDGVFFSYHGVPGEWYLIWDGMGMRIEALFDLEAAAAHYPSFGGTTFVTRVLVNGEEMSAYGSSWGPAVLSEEAEYGLVRCLPPKLQLVEGDVIGTRVYTFSDWKLVVSCMTYNNEFNFLNLSFIRGSSPVDASGIMGQTGRPAVMRQPNETYFLRRQNV